MSPLPCSVETLREIDSACDRLESEWLAGRQPRVEEFLLNAPERDREASLSALLDVHRELICRDNAVATPWRRSRASRR